MRRAGAAIAGLLLCGCSIHVRHGGDLHPSREERAESPIRFRDIAGAQNIRFVAGILDRTPLNITKTMAGGAGWIDYDGDGYPDLVLTGLHGAALYHNEAGGGFREASLGVDRVAGELQGVASGDYDGDGRPDLLLTRYDGAVLLRNEPGGFRDVSREAGIDLRGWTTSAAFADVDNDGRLDLFIGRYVKLRPGMPEFVHKGNAQISLGPTSYPADYGVLYHSDGKGRFRDVTQASGLGDAHGKVLGVSFADLDGNGRQNLFLASDQVLSDFYRNDGRGRFHNAAIESGVAVSVSGSPMSGMGIDWGDLHTDGRLDLIVTTLFGEAKGVFAYEGDGLFREASLPLGITNQALPWTGFGVAFADGANAGALDLLVANGHIADQTDRADPDIGYAQPTQVLRNEDGRFRDVSAGAGEPFRKRIVGRGLAVADFNGDGKPDAVVASLSGPPLLLQNESSTGNWVTLRLIGKGANRDAIGARVTLDDGHRKALRIIQTGRSYLSAFLPEASFGLGSSRTASAEIRWPDGMRQHVASLQINAVNRVREP